MTMNNPCQSIGTHSYVDKGSPSNEWRSSLRILSQEATRVVYNASLAEHIVLKSSPFHLVIGLADWAKPHINLDKFSFRFKLVYMLGDGQSNPSDFYRSGKEVVCVHMSPAECCFGFGSNESRQVLRVKARIDALSSQHEGLLFQLVFAGVDPATNQPVEGLAVASFPIRVVSKRHTAVRSRKKPHLASLAPNTTSQQPHLPLPVEFTAPSSLEEYLDPQQETALLHRLQTVEHLQQEQHDHLMWLLGTYNPERVRRN